MTSTVRSKAIQKAWKHRKPLHICAFCHKGIWTSTAGFKRQGRYYHNNCWDRAQIAKQYHSTARRGYYKRYGG